MLSVWHDLASRDEGHLKTSKSPLGVAVERQSISQNESVVPEKVAATQKAKANAGSSCWHTALDLASHISACLSAGVTVVGRIIRRTGRASIIVLLLSVLIIVG